MSSASVRAKLRELLDPVVGRPGLTWRTSPSPRPGAAPWCA